MSTKTHTHTLRQFQFHQPESMGDVKSTNGKFTAPVCRSSFNCLSFHSSFSVTKRATSSLYDAFMGLQWGAWGRKGAPLPRAVQPQPGLSLASGAAAGSSSSASSRSGPAQLSPRFGAMCLYPSSDQSEMKAVLLH